MTRSFFSRWIGNNDSTIEPPESSEGKRRARRTKHSRRKGPRFRRILNGCEGLERREMLSGDGLFTGPDPVANKLIQTGDALFGSTVVLIQPLARTSMNGLGQIGFVAHLANSDVVIARANPFAGSSPFGDYDGSGVTDASDYVVWRHSLGETGAVLLADGDGSGTVDSADYAIWRSHFGTAASIRTTLALSSTASVPEPASGLLVIMAIAVGRWQWRRRATASTAR